MRRILILMTVIFAFPTVVRGQEVAIPQSIEIMVIAPGLPPATAVPIATRTTPISVADTNCGITTLPPAGPTPLINPLMVYFDDPFTTGRFCRANMPTGVPNGQDYQAVGRFIAGSCTVNNSTVTPCPGPRSLVAVPLFTIQPVINPPGTPTNLRVRPA